MADTPLIGWTEHGQGTVIRAEKTGTEIHFAWYTKVMLKVDPIEGIFLYSQGEVSHEYFC